MPLTGERAMLIQVLFYLFATILVLAALGVITSRNPVYSALALVLCFVTAAATVRMKNTNTCPLRSPR